MEYLQLFACNSCFKPCLTIFHPATRLQHDSVDDSIECQIHCSVSLFLMTKSFFKVSFHLISHLLMSSVTTFMVFISMFFDVTVEYVASWVSTEAVCIVLTVPVSYLSRLLMLAPWPTHNSQRRTNGVSLLYRFKPSLSCADTAINSV